MKKLLALLFLPLAAFADTLGYNGTPDGAGNSDVNVWATPLLTMPAAGTFTEACAHATDEGDGSGQLRIRFYSSTGTTLATSAIITGYSGSGSFRCGSISYAASASEQIRIALITDGAPLYPSFTNGFSGEGYQCDPDSCVTGFAFPADPVGFFGFYDWRLAVYGTYTLSGGSPLLKILQQH